MIALMVGMVTVVSWTLTSVHLIHVKMEVHVHMVSTHILVCAMLASMEMIVNSVSSKF